MAINDLKQTLGLGARANKYKVYIAAPVGGADDNIIDTLCKAVDAPGKNIGTIEVYNQGRKLLVAGDTSFDNEWEVTFWSTQDHDLRKKFIDWMDYIDNFDENKREAQDHNSYMSQGAKFSQLDTRDNSEVATYTFHNLFPTAVGPLSYASDSADSILEFQISFSYSHWTKD